MNLDDARVRGGILVVMVCVLVVVCFYPLALLFFSQDDLQLVYEAVSDLPGKVAYAFSNTNSYHFRPLTKHVYFFVMFKAFGINALPFHLMSLLLHLCNTVLVFALLRRFRIPREAAAVATACFGLNAAYFHAIGWIACIQQLLPTAFSLTSILTGLIALDRASVARDGALRWGIVSGLAYVGALLSAEQAFAAPLLTLVASTCRLTGTRHRFKQVLRILGPPILLMFVYLAMRFFWKGLPATGISRFEYGDNVKENLWVYLGAFFRWWPKVATVITLAPFKIRPSHVALGLVVVYQLARLRIGIVAFATLAICAAIGPVLFQHKHYFFYHTYIAGIAIAALISGPIEDFLDSLPLSKHRDAITAGTAACLILCLFLPSAITVRYNIDRASNVEPSKYSGSFVVRRAEIAGNAWQSWPDVAPFVQDASSIDMVYSEPRTKAAGRPVNASSQHGEIVWALGRGRAINVFMGRYDIKVNMMSAGGDIGDNPKVVYYDSVGRLRPHDPED